MKSLRTAVVAAVAAFALVGFVAPPAHAGTRAGTISCGAGGRVSVRGEQQRAVLMTIRANGVVGFRKADRYVYLYDSNVISGTWDVTSTWLLWSESFAGCRGYLV